MIKIKGLNTYPGGKASNGMYQNIINCIRPHEQLIIGFLGNCAVLRNIRLPKKVIAIDLDKRVTLLWETADISAVNVINTDAISFLKAFSKQPQERTVIYLDPPYPRTTRRSRAKIYKYELSEQDHIALLETIKEFKCDVLISSYKNDLYDSMLHGWATLAYPGQTRQGKTVEYLYMNYNNTGELHDYSFVGNNFRERERIKRKIKRWRNNLLELPAIEKNAIIDSFGPKPP